MGNFDWRGVPPSVDTSLINPNDPPIIVEEEWVTVTPDPLFLNKFDRLQQNYNGVEFLPGSADLPYPEYKGNILKINKPEGNGIIIREKRFNHEVNNTNFPQARMNVWIKCDTINSTGANLTQRCEGYVFNSSGTSFFQCQVNVKPEFINKWFHAISIPFDLSIPNVAGFSFILGNSNDGNVTNSNVLYADLRFQIRRASIPTNQYLFQDQFGTLIYGKSIDAINLDTIRRRFAF